MQARPLRLKNNLVVEKQSNVSRAYNSARNPVAQRSFAQEANMERSRARSRSPSRATSSRRREEIQLHCLAIAPVSGLLRGQQCSPAISRCVLEIQAGNFHRRSNILQLL